jgi:hypothetical protein
MKARTLLKKLTDHGLTVKTVGDNIRLSPTQLINKRVVSFVRTHKNDLLGALHDEHEELHREHKLALHQGRVHVLRILLWRFLKNDKCRLMVNYQGNPEINDKAVEIYLDSELVSFGYDLEVMIDMYRIYTPEPDIVDKVCNCGYIPPFCLCTQKNA